jgi:hypothetical protein
MSGALRAFLLIAAVGGVGLALVLFLQFKRVVAHPTYGTTFSPAYARFLGLDPHQAFVAILDELPLRQVRLPVHWDEIQPSPEDNRFEELDWYMAEAAKRNVRVILAIGNKVPRWPECYAPDWANQLPQDQYEQALLSYTETIVTRYRTHTALERWQVENEPLFIFGECPKLNYPLVRREIATVRALDAQHPIQLTVSGEQQIWASVARDADIIGTSLYRKVALPNGVYFTFPIPPRAYTLQTISIALFVDKVVISELQMEPWLIKDYREYSLDEAADLFTPRQLSSYLRYAQSTGLKEISLWGVEWWYYLKQNGHPELWEAGREYLQ